MTTPRRRRRDRPLTATADPGASNCSRAARYYAHLTEQQMAAVLGIAPGTVKSRLSRALKLLADDPDLSDLRGAR
ncbi:MAG: sigma factor-like helix-turn-helix DNA-binding protein [Nocardioides sp.]|uniref:RNA polymerase sigma factor n=1 Tax=Nocardioides sp. TaxID=35761 RepID=UPI0039E6D2D8